MDVTEIIQGKLWVGSAPSYDDLAGLKASLGPEPVVIDLNRNPREEELCRQLGVEYDNRTPRVEDNQKPVPVSKLRLVARIVEENVSKGRQIYLHCSAGMGRSPTCAAAYLIQSGMSLSEAKNMVKSRPPVWTGKDASYAESLVEFAEMQDIANLSDSEPT